MENTLTQRSRRNISFSYLYNGATHKFSKPETSSVSYDFSNNPPKQPDRNRNFFNSPIPERRSDNNDN